MTEMMERLARALASHATEVVQMAGHHRAGAIDRMWPEYVEDVRAVLLALRQPSEGMVEAGCVAMFGAGSKPDAGWPECIRTASTSAITAAINSILQSHDGE